jgi:MGT family glycosyltransferase
VNGPSSGTALSTGRHVVVFTFPAYAHVAPALPLLAELVRRGHRVSCLVAPRFAEMVGGTGAEPVPYDSPFPWEAGPSESVLENMLSFFEESLAPLTTAVARFADDRPDLVAHDLAASETARLLARSWDVPVVQLCPTMASSPGFSMSQRQGEEATDPAPQSIDPGDPSIAEFVARRGRVLAGCVLEDVPLDGFGAEHGPNVVFMPRAFQIEASTFDDRFVFVGPCLAAPPAAGTWSPPEDGRPVVLVSLGSSHSPDQAAFLRTCIQGLAGPRWHVVTTLGGHVSPDELGPVPDGVEVHRWLPQPEVLRHAAVFLTHGGMGSLMESVSFSVPTVLAPHHVDQRVIAGRAAELDLGRVVERASSTPESVRAAVDEVASHPGIRAAVERMRRHIAEAGGAARGADFLESLMTPARAARGPNPRRQRR